MTVTGDGPAYSLAFTVPKGEQGKQGPPGEVSQAALDAAVASLVDNAPEALDTLSELADALGNDPNFATTVSTEIGKRVLIDGAPAEYDTLGKLVTALQNHELGGSTDASLLTGALTDQANVGEALFAPPGDAMEDMTVLQFVQAMLSEFGKYALTNHKHPVADVTGLQAALDGKEKKSWTGTQAQYDALGSYDPNVTYYVIEE